MPQPDFLEFSLPNGYCTLVTNDGSTLTNSVVQKLSDDGNKVVVLNLPNIANPTISNGINLLEYSDVAIEKAIQQIETTYGKVGSFIHLHPHFEFQKPNFTQHFAKEKPILKTVFLLAKHLQKSLNDLGSQQRANFLTISRMDGKLGQGKRGNTSLLAGGLTGLVKCLNLEWSNVFCRAVDIQPELSNTEIANQIFAEFHDPNVQTIEVGYSKEGRNTTCTTPIEVIENQNIRTTVSSASVFLVSGGGRGVTATCVIEMAKSFQCKFILLGRSDFDFEVPAYAINESDEGALKRLIMTDLKEKGEKPSLPLVKKIFKNIVAKKEISATINSIKSYNGEVIYIKGDVTNYASFQEALKTATATFGDITGIIHGAGRLADKYIQDKTETDFNNVLSVKLDGMLSLFQSCNVHQLKHLILFSSVAGFYGNVGQTDYAIANEILSKAAHLFKTNHPNTQVSAINWGAWDSGMVSGELKAQFEAAGVTLVNSEGGAAMMVNELNIGYANQPQVIIGGTLPAAVSDLTTIRTHRIRRKLQERENPFLQDHIIQGNAVLPIVNAVGWMVHSCESLYPDFRFFQIKDTKLFKGIVFDGSEKEEYILEAKELEKNDEKIVFETTILSEGGKLPTYHYKAIITLIHKNTELIDQKFKHQLSGNYAVTDGSTLYQDGTLFHGKYFRGIQQVLDCNERQLVLSCNAPTVSLHVQGQFQIDSINTFFADIQYQGMLVWVAKQKQGAKSLPIHTKQATLYRKMPFDKTLFVHMEIVEATDFQMMANCTVYDEAGNVYVKTEGAAVTISRDMMW